MPLNISSLWKRVLQPWIQERDMNWTSLQENDFFCLTCGLKTFVMVVWVFNHICVYRWHFLTTICLYLKTHSAALTLILRSTGSGLIQVLGFDDELSPLPLGPLKLVSCQYQNKISIDNTEIVCVISISHFWEKYISLSSTRHFPKIRAHIHYRAIANLVTLTKNIIVSKKWLVLCPEKG